MSTAQITAAMLAHEEALLDLAGVVYAVPLAVRIEAMTRAIQAATEAKS